MSYVTLNVAKNVMHSRVSSSLLCYGHGHGYPSWLSYCDLLLRPAARSQCKYGPSALVMTSMGRSTSGWVLRNSSTTTKVFLLSLKLLYKGGIAPPKLGYRLPSYPPPERSWFRGVYEGAASCESRVLGLRAENQKSAFTTEHSPSPRATVQMDPRSSSTS